MGMTKDDVKQALTRIRDASTGRNIVENGQVQQVAACDEYVSVTIAAPDERELRAQLRSVVEDAIRQAAEAGGGTLDRVHVAFVAADEAGATDLVDQPRDVPLKQASSSKTVAQGSATPTQPGMGHVIAVGAGKGGVGKSTVAVNLAVGLARKGHTVGLLDGDIYGPSVPTLLGLHDAETMVMEGHLQPFAVHGIRAMTIGKLVDPEKPLIWRGPMAHGAFKQLIEQTRWGELDYLVIDLPPGTGDVPLTMAQMLSLTGAVIVCTPQRVAQDDAVRAVRMFQQLKVPLLGIVENMSYFVGDDGKEYDLFGRGGAEQMAQRMGLPFLGGVPINTKLRQHSDQGTPLANFDHALGGEQLARSIERLAVNVENEAALQGLKKSGGLPTLSVS